MSQSHIVVISGAGISAESGLSTFRGDGGLWEKYDVTQLATPEAFAADPALVLRFYNERRRKVVNAQPNAAHAALVELESKYKVTIITQNVDDLHERAGSESVIHLHGEILKAQSTLDPNIVLDTHGDDINLGDCCEQGGQLRPNVVWFGEDVPNIELARRIVQTADVLLVVGTSLSVYPAASLVVHSSVKLPKVVVSPELETEPTNAILVREKASIAVPRIARYWLESGRIDLSRI